MKTDEACVLGRRAWLGCVLLTGLALFVAPVPALADEAAPGTARSTIDEAIGEVLAVLAAEGLSVDERRSRIEAVAYERFDFVTMSKMVLGRNRRSFSKEQQSKFAVEFRSYLSNQYGHRVEGYEQESIEVLGERQETAFRGQEQGDITVFTKVVGGQFDGATIDYRMRIDEQGWRVIDVIIEGVSLVSNYRDQFGEVIARQGADGLLAQLEEKNASGVIDEVPTTQTPDS